MNASRRVGAAAAIAALIVTAAACGAPKDPETATDDATVLTVATATSANRPGAAQIEELARRVQDLSGGSMRIATQLKAAGDDTDAWNQAVAQLVEADEVDMALIPSRTWEGEGVATFRALSAPFLVTGDQVLKEVVAPSFAAPMLAGLKPLGLAGLALFPEGQRFLFSFADPIEDPGDLDSKVVRAPTSETTDEVLQSFGATPKPLPGNLFTQALAKGEVGATETSFGRAAGLPKPSTVTGNLALYPKINTLVISQNRLARLTAQERRVLQEAADATREWAKQSMSATAAEAAAYCKRGGTIFMAPVQGIAAFQAAVAPTIGRLEKDPATKALIARIRALTKSLPAPAALPACSPGQ